MKTIKEKAEEYISGYGDGYAPKGIDISQDPYSEERGFTLKDGKQIFIDGAKWALDNQWHKIERDNNDIATEECLDEIFENDSVLIHSNRNDTLQLLSEDYDYWRGDIKRQYRFDYWMVMPKIGKL